MGYTVGGFGLASLNKLLALMMGFYLTSGIFVVVVLGLILKVSGIPLFRYLAYIKDELLLVLGTSSSETALPGIMKKLEKLGCPKATVGLVIPTGYSFNLDGTNIYMTMAAVFLAQATNTKLDLSHQIALLVVAMITSKGASGVTGAGFITLAATLEAVASVQAQQPAPEELIVVVDHNPALQDRLAANLPGVRVVANGQEQGLSGARNTGAELATADIVVFLDDAEADELISVPRHGPHEPRLARVVAEHTAEFAYACRNFMPPAARRSTLAVVYSRRP
jgi:hypothetical protein